MQLTTFDLITVAGAIMDKIHSLDTRDTIEQNGLVYFDENDVIDIVQNTMENFGIEFDPE